MGGFGAGVAGRGFGFGFRLGFWRGRGWSGDRGGEIVERGNPGECLGGRIGLRRWVTWWRFAGEMETRSHGYCRVLLRYGVSSS